MDTDRDRPSKQGEFGSCSVVKIHTSDEILTSEPIVNPPLKSKKQPFVMFVLEPIFIDRMPRILTLRSIAVPFPISTRATRLKTASRKVWLGTASRTFIPTE
jgi:hypothetical protein